MCEVLKDPLFADAASYWRFDRNLNDDKGNNNLINGAYALVENEGRFGGGCLYVPSGGYAIHGRTNLSYSAMTLSLWLKPKWNWNDSANHGIWQNNNNSNVNQANWVSLFKYSSNNLYWRVGSPSGTLQDLAPVATSYFTADTWTHVVAYYSAAGMGIYINNVLVASRGAITPPNAFLDTNCRLAFGHQASGGCARFSDVVIFNRVLTADEVGRLNSYGVGGLNKLSYYRRTRMVGEITGTDKNENILLDVKRSRFVGDRPLLGEAPENPVESAVKLKKMRPEVTTGYYWIKTKYMDTPARVYCNYDFDGGGWMRLNSSIATLSSPKGSNPVWYVGDNDWQPDLVYGSNVPSGCGNTTSVVTVTCTKLDYTEAIVLLQRESTIIQCAGFTGAYYTGYYDSVNNRYTGTSTALSFCSWGDNLWAGGCCGTAIGGCKKNVIAKCNLTNQQPIAMSSECSDGSDTGRYLSYYYVR